LLIFDTIFKNKPNNLNFMNNYKLPYLLLLVLFTGVVQMLAKDNIDTQENFVPQWAKKVVWYQIFPDRFYNGDKNNDPDVSTLKGSWPHDYTSPWEVHPWISDWYQLQPYELINGKDIWFNIQRRRYGGDLQGIINKLDYLSELGITAIYLNPVFEAPSLHKYDGATYHHIDPNFGPDPEDDRRLMASEIPDDPTTWKWTEADKLFLKLVDLVHKRGIRIIIDGVFNHMGINSWAFKDVIKNQQNSKYKDWFTIKSWDNKATGEKFTYEGWFGVAELPELREDENGIVASPKKYIFDITNRWMDPDGDGDPSDGIDGWRLDVAYCIKHPFWKDWRKHVKSINPEGYITAEVIDAIPVVEEYLKGDEFDAVMNYNYLFACSEYFFDDKTAVSVTEFDRLLKDLRSAFPECVSFVQQNLHGSHDTQRMASHLVNKDKYKIRNWTDTFDKWKGSNPDYNTGKPNEKENRILKLTTIFQFTYTGAPYIYYGEEAGMWGANDPDCRKPMVWKEMKYDNEVYLPDQSKRIAPIEVNVNTDVLNHYKKLVKIRNDNEALQLGDFTTLLTDDKRNVYAFSRNYNDESIIVIINNSDVPVNIELAADGNSYQDLLNGDTVNADGKTLKADVAYKWGRILIKK
jgi:cyclomaltodextrinase / maltogenic alpha-amylase / neopullulanase